MSASDDVLRDRLRAAIDSSPSGLLMVDQNGTIVLINREIERCFGYPREELLGRSVDSLVPEHVRVHHPGYRRDFLANPRARAMGAGRELFARRKDGTEFPVEIGLTPVVTEEGLFVIAAVVDITERKRNFEDRKTLELQLLQAQRMEMMGVIAGGVAHDFNNILAAIIGRAEMIHDASTDEAVKLDVSEILKASERGRQIVRQILAFSRKQERKREPLSLGRTLMEVFKLLQVSLPPSVRVHTRIADGEAQVVADATAIHQIVMNLGTNAAHAMPQGGTIELGAETSYVRDSLARAHPDLHEGPYCVLTIQDNGTGIPAENLNRVFEPFFTTKDTGQGSGLGLAVVKSIMREHEGAVTLESHVGKGTTVRCYFPLTTEVATEVATLPGELPRGKGERVLFVEDEVSLNEVGKRRLVALGYVVESFLAAEPALAAIAVDPHRFDVLLTDHQLPGMTGLELARQVRAIRVDVPIILQSGYPDTISQEGVLRSGVQVVAEKPLTARQLAEILHRTLTGAKPAS
jgi:PAS domain S-box-containing protein